MIKDDAASVQVEELVADITESLVAEYDITATQIEMGGGQLKGRVTVELYPTAEHDLDDFPGFGHSSVPVLEMTDEPVPAYKPVRNPGNRYKMAIYTTEIGTPNCE